MRPLSPHERAEIHITAELGPWQTIPKTNHVEGYIIWTNDKAQTPGEKIILMNVRLVPFPKSNMFGEEHFIAETKTNRFYLLKTSKAIIR